MKTRNATKIAISLILGIVLCAAMVMGQPGGVSAISEISDSRADLSGVSPQSNEAQAGNVTELVITGTQITRAWQGYFGNISGTITLENSAGNVFYNWSGLGSISGEVYASRDNAVTWASVNCTNSGNITAENTFLGKTAGEADSVGNTFNETNHPTFLVGNVNISQNSCNTTNAYINTGSSNTDFYQILLADLQGDIVYTTLIDQDQTGFDGRTFDFELLVGENGNETQDTIFTTYFFYIELS